MLHVLLDLYITGPISRLSITNSFVRTLHYLFLDVRESKLLVFLFDPYDIHIASIKRPTLTTV